MSTPSKSVERELVITRLIDAPPEAVFKAFVDPEMLKQWFVPRPWTIAELDIDPRPGGKSMLVMRSPDGEEFPSQGVYLEVIPNEKIVTTDAYTEAWVPSDKPFMTAIMTFENENGKTRYTARARHWTDEDVETHKSMGFQEGWGQTADQLAELVTGQNVKA